MSPSLATNQYVHTTWNQEEGSALPQTLALAQTANGYLWLGTETGLKRFDGMRFVDWSPASGANLPSPRISCLRAASAGGLWVGTIAGVCRLDRGRIISYRSTEKMPCKAVLSMTEDRSGGLWMVSACPNRYTVSLLSKDGTLKTFQQGDGLPAGQVLAILRDSQDRLWMGTSDSICSWSPGRKAVCSREPRMAVVSMAESAGGQLVLEDSYQKQLYSCSNAVVRPIGPRAPDVEFTPQGMLRDRDGNIWIGTIGQGLLRLRGSRTDRFTRADGLSSNTVNSLLEDREGNIWVATERGIDRFRDPKAQLFTTLNGLSGDAATAVYGARDGATWVGTTGGLTRIAGDRLVRYSTAAGLPGIVVNALFEDATGRLWAGTAGGLAVQSGDRFTEVRAPDGQHFTETNNIGSDPSGAVCIVDRRRGLFRIRSGLAERLPLDVAELADVYGMMVARNRDIWLGHYNGGITVLGHSVKQYDARDGLAGGPVHAFCEDRDGTIWVGAGQGLSRFSDSRWKSWMAPQDLPEANIQGMVEDEAGGLWLRTKASLLELPLADLKAPGKLPQYSQLGRADGLRLGVGSTNPQLARSRDGRLWVATDDGVAAIDPARVHRNPVLPPVVIEQALANGKELDLAAPGEKVFRADELQITYTGVSLTDAERVHFRYRMFGLENDWTDAGTRRSVTYAHMRPGHYRFQVIASNNDGVWNYQGETLALRVFPYYYETTWFYALLATTVALGGFGWHRIRVRIVVARLKAIAAERTRFSRELHDSLLQGFSGVVLQLEAAARQFHTAPDVARKRLEKALDQADASLREGRQILVSMRIPNLENATLPEALRSATMPIVSGMPLRYEFEVKGRVRQAPYDVEANLFLIAREAVLNAVNHAEAARIRLELHYLAKELRVTIEDDGKGLNPEDALAKTGHLGFRSMHERALHIGGVWNLDTGPAHGTRIEIVVPWKK